MSRLRPITSVLALAVLSMASCRASPPASHGPDSSARPADQRASARVQDPSARLDYGDVSDVETFIETSTGVRLELTRCENIRLGGAVTRGLACEGRLSPSDLATLTGKFALTTDKVAPPRDLETGRCAQRSGFTAPEIVRRGARWGCGPPARGFGYVEVHVDAATGLACIETEYNWSC